MVGLRRKKITGNTNNSDTTTYRNREPVYDGKAKSCDKLKIDWNAYVEVKGISFTLDNTIDTSKL